VSTDPPTAGRGPGRGRRSRSPLAPSSYDLGRAFDSFKVTIGLRDDSNSAGRTKFEVFLDGRSAAARTVGVEVFSTWADARLLGDPAKVPPTT
jgi:hypothetical protein